MGALAGLLLVLVLPAVAGSVLLSGSPREGSGDREVGPATVDLALARGLACGLGTWLLGSGLLARTVGLTAASAWTWDAAVALVSVGVLALPRQRRVLAATLGPLGRRLGAVGGLTALVYVPMLVVVLSTSWSPIGSTPWYYYGLARQIADLGSTPATSVEFGTTTPFLNDYHLFSTGTAMLLLQHGGGPVLVLILIALLSVLMVGIGAAALSSVFTAGRYAALLAVPVVVGSGIGTIRLTAYRPEGFGLGMELLLVALALDWLRARDRGSLIAAGVLVASLSQVHGIAALCSGILVTAGAIALLTRASWRQQARRTLLALAVFVGALVVTALVFHEASGTATSQGLVDQGGLGDPTWEFYQAARGYAPSMPPSNGSMLWGSLHSLYGRSFEWVVPALALAVFGLRLRWRDSRSREVVAFVVLGLVGLGLVCAVFMLGWQGYVPRRTGASRIPLEASLVLPPLLAVGLGHLAGTPWTWRLRGRSRTLRRPFPVLLALLVVGGIASLTSVADFNSSAAVGRQELAVWRSLPLHRGDVVLTNGYTEGFIPDVSPAEGLLDGRAPYTFGAQLHRADRLMRDAQAFFTDPAQHWGYLAQHHVTWVVVGTPGSYALSTGNTWSVPTSLRGLEQCSGLRRSGGDSKLAVFRVVDAGPSGCSARP